MYIFGHENSAFITWNFHHVLKAEFSCQKFDKVNIKYYYTVKSGKFYLGSAYFEAYNPNIYEKIVCLY